MTSHRFLIAAVFFLAASNTFSAEEKVSVRKATIYEAGTHRNPPLFRYQRTDTVGADGVLRSDATFTAMDGSVAYSEKAESKDAKVRLYTWTHHQMNQSGKVEIHDGKTFYTLTENGQTKTDTAEAPKNLVIGPTMIAYLRAHWNELGDGVDVRIGVPDRMNDYGFVFVRVADPSLPADQVHVALKATGFFVSLAVKPINFIFSKDGFHLFRTEGMSLLKIRRGDKWDDLTAETVFE